MFELNWFDLIYVDSLNKIFKSYQLKIKGEDKVINDEMIAYSNNHSHLL